MNDIEHRLLTNAKAVTTEQMAEWIRHLCTTLEQFLGVPIEVDPEPIIRRGPLAFCLDVKGVFHKQGTIELHWTGVMGGEDISYEDGDRFFVDVYIFFYDGDHRLVRREKDYLRIEYDLEKRSWIDRGWQKDEYDEFW